jgi:hypothetical protein
MKKVFSLLTLVLVALVGCAPGAPPSPTEVTATSTSTFLEPTPSYAVEVTKDIEYLTLLEPDAPVQTLDVYAPTEPGPWPVVVVMPGWMQSKEYPVFTTLGEDLAGRGVVVFVPQRRSKAATLVEYVQENGREIREVHESWACGVRFARERAADYGGDAGRVTVFAVEGAGLELAFIGDDLQEAWDEVASNRGGPPPQTECAAVEGSAHVDAYIGYHGDYDFYERLSESAPDLWKLTSPFALVGRNPGLQVYLIHGGMAQETYIQRAVLLHEALVEAGYDATQMLLGEAEEQIPWSGPDREELIQLILEVARG